MSQNNMSPAELTVLVEGIVTQVLNKSFGSTLNTWASNSERQLPHLSYEKDDGNGNNAGQIADELQEISKLANGIAKSLNNPQNAKSLNNFGDVMGQLSGVAGIAGAYKNGDALGGALSGFQAFGTPFGAVLGLAAGLLSPGIDRWQRPEFKQAKQAFDKLYSMNRGEREDYYMPESFYFRQGAQGGRNITVYLGNEHFDNHIRESLTNTYASQLQRGLVF